MTEYHNKNIPAAKSNNYLKHWHIILLVILGTIVRLVYGIYHRGWLSAADQLAWGQSLEEMMHSGLVSYKQLIHYPHEGGSFFISLIAIGLRPFGNILPPLSMAALFVDTLSRFFQILLSRRIFGSPTAAWFALWTVMALPLILPWGTVNYGLHSLSSFIPFVFIYFATTYKSRLPGSVLCGIVAGFSVAFSYDNLILIPAYLVWVMFTGKNEENKLPHMIRFLGFALLALVPHILLRLFADNGFNLEHLPVTTIRGFSWKEFFSFTHLANILPVWYKSLPASFFLSAGNFMSSAYQRDIVLIFCFTGLGFSVLKIRENKRSVGLAFLIFITFTIAYALSPFYAGLIDMKTYLYYRHFSYILPLLALLVFNGFAKTGKAQFVLAGLWIIICGIFSTVYLTSAKPVTSGLYSAEGWILAKKYGEDVSMLMRLYKTAPADQQEELMIGFGWGLTATLLQDKSEKDSLRVKQLVKIYNQFPKTQQTLLKQGIQQSFKPGITPILDPKLIPVINAYLGN